ncbi:hypothetical protein [Planctomicrobium sp. SH664]|uniref:hypothetical protein n=1 Tax=Planctomicrobium sp. SH664 TaxID=3448125 RepID=UPI003F5BEBF8
MALSMTIHGMATATLAALPLTASVWFVIWLDAKKINTRNRIWFIATTFITSTAYSAALIATVCAAAWYAVGAEFFCAAIRDGVTVLDFMPAWIFILGSVLWILRVSRQVINKQH